MRRFNVQLKWILQLKWCYTLNKKMFIKMKRKRVAPKIKNPKPNGWNCSWYTFGMKCIDIRLTWSDELCLNNRTNRKLWHKILEWKQTKHLNINHTHTYTRIYVYYLVHRFLSFNINVLLLLSNDFPFIHFFLLVFFTADFLRNGKMNGNFCKWRKKRTNLT